MTDNEFKAFKTLFGKYCRHEINLRHCTGDTCEWCPIQKAYDEVMRFESITVLIYDIKWDTDGDHISLPNEIKHTFKGYDTINDELLDQIADWLSDEYEYCHFGFNVKTIAEEDE